MNFQEQTIALWRTKISVLPVDKEEIFTTAKPLSRG